MRVSAHVQRGTFSQLDRGLRVPNIPGYKFIRGKTWEELKVGDNPKPYPQVLTPSNAGLLTEYNDRKYDYVPLPDAAMWLKWRFARWSSQNLLPFGDAGTTYKRPGNERTFYNFTPGSVAYVYGKEIEAHIWATEDGSAEAGYRDPVLKRNMNYHENINYLLRPHGGFLGRVLRTVGVYHHIEALDLTKPLPPFEWIIKRPWLWFWATQSDKVDGSTRFPMVKTANEVWGLPASGLALPMFTLGGEFKIPKSSTVDVDLGASYTPYVPKPR